MGIEITIKSEDLVLSGFPSFAALGSNTVVHSVVLELKAEWSPVVQNLQISSDPSTQYD